MLEGVKGWVAAMVGGLLLDLEVFVGGVLVAVDLHVGHVSLFRSRGYRLRLLNLEVMVYFC